jgi:hypothetical protein
MCTAAEELRLTTEATYTWNIRCGRRNTGWRRRPWVVSRGRASRQCKGSREGICLLKTLIRISADDKDDTVACQAGSPGQYKFLTNVVKRMVHYSIMPIEPGLRITNGPFLQTSNTYQNYTFDYIRTVLSCIKYMARNLALSQYDLIHDMRLDKKH